MRNNDVVKRHIELNGNTANSLHKDAMAMSCKLYLMIKYLIIDVFGLNFQNFESMFVSFPF